MSSATWKVISDSVIGTSHLREGLPCQDYCCVLHGALPSGEAALILLAADGAGSARFACEGATLFCELMAALLKQRLDQGHAIESLAHDDVLADLERVRDRIEALAAERGTSLRDFATTMLGAVVGERGASFFQIGDGAMVAAQGAQETYKVVFWPDRGEYANQTHFLTDPTWKTSLQTDTWQGSVDEVAVFTDGLQPVALHYATQTAHAPFFKPLLASLRAANPPSLLQENLRRFLDSPNLNRRTDDDKTLILATRRQPDSQPPNAQGNENSHQPSE